MSDTITRTCKECGVEFDYLPWTDLPLVCGECLESDKKEPAKPECRHEGEVSLRKDGIWRCDDCDQVMAVSKWETEPEAAAKPDRIGGLVEQELWGYWNDGEDYRGVIGLFVYKINELVTAINKLNGYED